MTNVHYNIITAIAILVIGLTQSVHAGYVDGNNMYAGYHVMQGATDPSGLTPKVGYFSGINSPINYLEKGFTVELGKDKANKQLVQTMDTAAKNGMHEHSELGTSIRDLPSDNLLHPFSRARMDGEARSIAEGYKDKFCCDAEKQKSPVKIRVMMFQPKTHKLPSTKEGCCDFAEVVTYWSPFDPVPNQGVGHINDTQKFWEKWGKAYAVDPAGLNFKNHDWRSIVRGEATEVERVEVQERIKNSSKIPGYHTVTRWRWQDKLDPNTGDPFKAPSVADKLNERMKPEEDGYVFICHSQGCNNLWHVLDRVCHDKK